MKTRFVILLVLFTPFLFLSTYAQEYDESIYEDIPDYCLIERVDSDAYDTFRAINTFEDVYYNLTKEFIETNFSEEKSYIFRDISQDIDLEVIFKGREGDGNTFGYYYHQPRRIEIFLGNIYDFSQLTSNNDTYYYIRSENTFKHELFHHLDKTYQSFGDLNNQQDIFNIEYAYNFSLDQEVLTNQEYFENITGSGNQSLIYQQVPLPAELRSSVNMEWVFQDYDLDNHIDETIARFSAVCTREINNFEFSFYPQDQYRLCQEFNFSDSSLNKFEDVVDEITENYFYETYPQYRFEPVVLGDEQCASYKSQVNMIQLNRAFFDILGLIMDNLIPIMISLTILLFIGIIMRFPEIFISMIKRIFK